MRIVGTVGCTCNEYKAEGARKAPKAEAEGYKNKEIAGIGKPYGSKQAHCFLIELQLFKA